MKIKLLIFVFLSSIILNAQWVYVQRVIDGDTFVTSNGERVRVKNIDTPETKHPKKGKEFLGTEASNYAKTTLEGKFVFLEGNGKDKYGRRVANVILSDGSNYADKIRLYGYDKNSSNFPTYNNDFNYLNKTADINSKINYLNTEKTWINGYYKKDGTYVNGHFRTTKNNTNQSFINSSTSTSKSIQSSNNSKVQVKGYYRKDGTYVKPYTRSKSSKK